MVMVYVQVAGVVHNYDDGMTITCMAASGTCTLILVDLLSTLT